MFELSDPTLSVLLGTTATVAVAHTLLGIDHSLPFIVIGRARHWSFRRTMAVTVGCGVGHVASSVLIGAVGALAGSTLVTLEFLEAARGQLAAALLIGFGLSYATWSFWRLQRAATHSHIHAHADGTVHDHPHDHRGEHLHAHAAGQGVTPWALFVIFLLGPCEPLIPLMVVPAMDQSWLVLGAVVAIFGTLTVATMVATVACGYHGLRLVPSRSGMLRYADVFGGLVVAASGGAVLFLGL